MSTCEEEQVKIGPQKLRIEIEGEIEYFYFHDLIEVKLLSQAVDNNNSGERGLRSGEHGLHADRIVSTNEYEEGEEPSFLLDDFIMDALHHKKVELLM